LNEATPLGPTERADLLYESQALEKAHSSAASQGQSSAPNAEDEVDLHYVCFVKDGQNNLWEMDGGRKGPLMRGALSAGEDVLSEKALDLGPRSFMKREAGAGELRFSLITLAPSLD
jgi:ubiquitin carboxyl-terminal hydrolase L3